MNAADADFRPGGIALRRAVLHPSHVAEITQTIDARYEEMEHARRQGGLPAVGRMMGTHATYVPTASSFTVGAALSDDAFASLLSGLNSGPAGEWIRNELGDVPVCDRNQAWVRRQFAPHRYPAMHAPHGWHQDGALRFDFGSHCNGESPPDALLSMVTCWISLTPCGVEAPGLELVTRRLANLLAPADLSDDFVRRRFAADEFRRPALEPGDALLFRGDILHRTHVTPAMTRDRTSVELRFFPANRIPARLAGDHFVRVG